jgi:hypothetical protein
MHGHLKRHFKRKNRDKTFVWNQIVRCFELSFFIAKNSDEDPHIQTCEGNTLSKHGCNLGIFTTENRLKEKSAVVNYKCSSDLTTWIYTVHSTSKIQHRSVHRLYFLRASVAQSSKQAPSWVRFSLRTHVNWKSQSTLCRKSWVFSGRSGFLPTGKVSRVGKDAVRKVILQLF